MLLRQSWGLMNHRAIALPLHPTLWQPHTAPCPWCSHIVWLVLLLLSMWRFRKFQVVPSDTSADLAAAAAGAGTSPETGSEEATAAPAQSRTGWLHFRGLGWRGKQGAPAAS